MEKNVWTKLDATVPAARCASIAIADGKAYIMGELINMSQHYCYDFQTQEVTLKANMHTPGFGFGTVYHNGKIYVVGGKNNQSCLKSLTAYDIETDTWETLADLPKEVFSGSIAIVNGYLYCAGGCYSAGGGSTGAFDSMYRYNISTNEWEQMANLIKGAIAPAIMPYYNGALYFFGGAATHGGDSFTTFPACQKYVISEDRWYEFTAPPISAYTPSITVVGNKVYLQGGSNGSYGESLVEHMYEYSLETDSWRNLDDIPYKCKYGQMTSYNNLIYMFGTPKTDETPEIIYCYDPGVTPSLKILLQEQESIQLIGMVLPSYAKVDDIDWQAANESIVTVDENGFARGVTPGTTRITVTAKDRGWSDSVLIKVEKKPEYKLSIQLAEGKACRLTASDDESIKVSWSSSNPDAAAVDSTGEVTALKEGVTIITVQNTEEGFKNQIYVKVIK